ncbi:class I SAM-dependent methyltransferase [Vibrio sp. 99-8-1]|uniref:class I SAM-dependent methyltransferase n=1 Tax=Vibrio sp. 99-8-1 TaxID=2607602 RepID=UPI00149340DB|nr:class I SAM-dependent methyltransferase [Vibrio sp. 99-8-1]NOI66434.1 methyltransferase domain-containing protein [Vibrio sp. 99-8-1]
MSSTCSFYDKNAQKLSQQYNSVSFESAHASWKTHWPKHSDKVLDVGAGSGRDALWMAEQGADVIALEPSLEMIEQGKALTKESVTWLNDELPSLNKAQNLAMRFDLILVSAVWMHIAPNQRKRAFRKLTNLLAPNGNLVITLRHGGFEDERVGHSVSVDELKHLAQERGVTVKDVNESDDSLNRMDVHWQTVVLTLPDDGSGDLKKVRRIIVNDSKSSTYKLALLRVLLRIADAHPGCVIDRTDREVSIPLGLVALYWIKAYKRLIDVGDLQQNSNSSKGLTFITSDGWEKISKLSADDLAVGSVYFSEEAEAIQKTIQASIKAMKEGPIKFIYTDLLGSNNQEFTTLPPVHRRKMQSSICLDSEFFESYGSFVLKQSLWECFQVYNSWIEPLVVNQWVAQMQRFKLNQQNGTTLQTYHDCLQWLDRDHDTSDVRKRVTELQQDNEQVISVWSGTKLNKTYHVDHCLPFAHWPNNDKWNLLPTTQSENLNKKDRLPSKLRLHESKYRILEWWQLAWGADSFNQQRFFTEASFSLPNISSQNHDFEEVFEAMALQVNGVKSRLLVGEW